MVSITQCDRCKDKIDGRVYVLTLDDKKKDLCKGCSEDMKAACNSKRTLLSKVLHRK